MTKNNSNKKNKNEKEFGPVDIFEKSEKISGDWLDRGIKKERPRQDAEKTNKQADDKELSHV